MVNLCYNLSLTGQMVKFKGLANKKTGQMGWAGPNAHSVKSLYLKAQIIIVVTDFAITNTQFTWKNI